MTRAEAAIELCQRLGRDVEAIAPPGLGGWSTTWELVGDAGASFIVALTAWEITGSEADRLKVRDAYDRVLNAWRGAVAKYQREGAGT